MLTKTGGEGFEGCKSFFLVDVWEKKDECQLVSVNSLRSVQMEGLYVFLYAVQTTVDVGGAEIVMLSFPSLIR
jgi:hypothetical protein